MDQAQPMTEQQQVADCKVIKFGISQFSNPTPKIATTIQRVINAFVGAWGAILVAAPTMIPEHTQAEVNKWILIVPILALFVKSAFGWDCPKDQSAGS